MRRRTAAALLAFLIAIACTGSAPDRSLRDSHQFAIGGTLRLATIGDGYQHLDPGKEYDTLTWELFRCCLLRTLMSYNGTPTSEGGAIPRPDLADGQPELSDDGLTWTFHLKQGLIYAPPMQHVEITSLDIIRGVERMLQLDVTGVNSPRVGAFGDYDFYFVNEIDGAREFDVGQAEHISGLSAPDPHTLRVRLLRPSGDLPYLLAMPGTAPVPPSLTDPTALFGAAAGHDRNYGRFLIASGPYMFEGSDRLDPSKATDQQEPVSGYRPAALGHVSGIPDRLWVTGGTIALVRNPSWSREADTLRAAYPDRIEISMNGDTTTEKEFRTLIARLGGEVDSGVIDMVFSPFGLAPASQINRYRVDPLLRSRLDTEASPGTFWLNMNTAVPPFDDVDVRRAANWALDKAAILEADQQLDDPGLPPVTGQIATHIAPDSQEKNLLVNYDPYATTGHQGSDREARAEMRLSKYDSDDDGRCDITACHRVPTLMHTIASKRSMAEMTAILERAFHKIGITLDVKPPMGDNTFYAENLDVPAKRIPLAFGAAWFTDYPSAQAFMTPLFDSTSLKAEQNFNTALLGATQAQLRRWGYPTSAVPDVDDRIARCVQALGVSSFTCWADLDHYLMEQVVPWVPLFDITTVRVFSGRVAQYSFDQGIGMPALDGIALTPGAITMDRS